ncbi:MAG TPA: RICIN domain-containing protein [Archangium sp.]|uniref:RICIN domain-containing protein n=1 Tax=Archangium sp. TaxID=1872627 RepID=UPI002E36CF96|nr:RICIN domain-containing protein [Archangium sp.]HEX5753732.1 RICIN domain-containing protein [Archangium sp.]
MKTAARSLMAEPGQYVRLTARHSGKCLGVAGSSQADEAQILQWDCNGSRDQAFLFEPVGSVYRIKAWHSGKCLAQTGGYLVQRDCGAASYFTQVEHGDGSYSIAEAFIQPSLDYSPRHLDVESASTANGARVLLYTPTGGSNQRFTTLAYREQAGLDACKKAPPARDELPWCGGYYVGPDGCWTQLTSHVYEWCRRYGVNFGAEWGPGYDNHRYYDAIDRCAFWHDYTTWTVPNDPIINDAQAWMCMAMVQPASVEEERARSHGVYWLAHDPATLARAGGYIDPRLASNRRPAPFPVRANDALPQPDSFMQVPWARQQGGYWNEQQWMAGDFNGDGATDLAKVFNENGLASVDVHVTGLRGFTRVRWVTQDGGFWDRQKWMAGDFNGDGRADLVNVFNDGWQTWADVHVSTGSGFVRKLWQNQGGNVWPGEKWLTGDFNGDGKVDLANVFYDNGLNSIEVHVSTGGSFVRERWQTQGGGFWDTQKWIAGDFNGDGYDDIANVFGEGGLVSIDVHVSSGSSFTISRWVTRQGVFNEGQQWMAMRRTSVDGVDTRRTDLVSAFFDNGYDSIAVRRSVGSTFAAPELWATRYGVHLGHAPVSYSTWAARRWLTGNFNTAGSVARVYSDGGLVSADVYVR